MPVKLSLAKALIIIMLVVLLATAMETTVGLPEDAQESDTLHVDHTPLTLRQKRYLRSTANLTSSTLLQSSVGARRLTSLLSELKKLSANMGESTSAIISSATTHFKATMFGHQQELSNDKFIDLKLNDMEQKLFDNPNLDKWIDFVKANTLSQEEAVAQMCRTLWHMFPKNSDRHAYLVKNLGGVKALDKHGKIAKLLRERQMGIWANLRMTPKEASEYLGMNRVLKDDLIDSPEFTMWGAYMTQRHQGYRDALHILAKQFDSIDADLVRKLAAIHVDSESFSFAQGLIYYYCWFLRQAKIDPAIFYKDLKFDISLFTENISKSLLKEPLVRIWLDYTYLKAMVHWKINENQVLKTLNDVFGDGNGMNILKKLKGMDNLGRVGAENETNDLATSMDRILEILKKNHIPLQD
ncbi:unnamed protein product [Peronospora farinosa]|uniref:RxLR effector protein n=1 Tax=Peronospora farinosa TaxID=134698 RepID=A0AAV0TD33_9STRA|nr:unnamed protein product [Peronospora farinosa]CAI5717229.1 unnamed protein product [Peronospora farinosa]